MRKAYDGSLIKGQIEKQMEENQAAVKCRGCDSIHPLKYKLDRCPVCGHALPKKGEKL